MNVPIVFAKIDLKAVEENIIELKRLTDPKVKFMAVVKADAYGHGAVKVAKTALKTGADCLGVARFNEAKKLRKAGIDAPILIFGFTPSDLTKQLASLDLTTTVYSAEMAEQLSHQARKEGVIIKAHLKIDTGMGRLGLLPDSRRPIPISKSCDAKNLSLISNENSITDIKKILSFPGLELEGIYTHFAAADSSDKTYARYQLGIFNLLLKDLKKEKIEFSTCHAANSAALIDIPESHFDMVRAGIAIYGLYPSPEVNKTKAVLKPAMELKAIITSVKRVPRGFLVSYGMTYETKKETLIASVPIGYADGFSRLLSSKGFMLVNGMRAPIAGRVCMDQTLIDVGHIPRVKTGDEVVIMGSQSQDNGEKEIITADEIASLTGTINYEIVSSLTARIPKLY